MEFTIHVFTHIYTLILARSQTHTHTQTSRNLGENIVLFTHTGLLSEGVFMFKGVVGELGGVVCGSVTVISGTIESTETCKDKEEQFRKTK